MNELTGILAFIVLLAFACLALAAILMPIVVLMIDGRVEKIRTTLAAMEHMMRNGK